MNSPFLDAANILRQTGKYKVATTTPVELELTFWQAGITTVKGGTGSRFLHTI